MTTDTRALHARSFDVPDQTRTLGDMAQLEIVALGDGSAVRGTVQSGFHWKEHAGPVIGTDLCQVQHRGYVVAGRIRVRMADGTEREIASGDVFDIPPDHDMWVISDEPYISVEFS